MSISTGVGLISGLDYNSLISQMTALNSRPIRTLQTRQAELQSKSAAYMAVNAKLAELNGALDNLKDAENQRTTRGSSSSSDVSASATTGAAEGTYEVRILQTARAERRASQGIEDTDTVIADGGAGQLVFSIGDGTEHTIEIDAGMTLEELRDELNDVSGLRANIINDGSDDAPYRLSLSVANTGADNTIGITQNDTILKFDNTIDAATEGETNGFVGTVTTGGAYTGEGAADVRVEVTTAGDIGVARFRVSFDGGETWSADDAYTTGGDPVDIGDGVTIAFSDQTSAFTEGDTFDFEAYNPMLQEARDALITIDGIEVQSSTNTFDEAIEGLTLTAKTVSDDGESATVTVSQSTSNMTAAVTRFVGAYNQVVDQISTLTSYDRETNEGSVLTGDATVNNIRNQLINMVTSTVDGIDSNINTLSRVGVGLDRTGHLVVDADELDSALDNNFDEVVALFAATGSSASGDLSFVSSDIDNVAAGSYAVEITAAAEQAQFTASTALVGGLALAETLTFTQGGQTATVSLGAGDTLADIIDTINLRMAEEDFDVVAYDDDGKLGLRTEAYGTEAEFTVKSSLGAAGQSGVGTDVQELEGVDVAGTIGGQSAIGVGRQLMGANGTDAEGLTVEVTATETGAVGSIDVRYGVAEQLSRMLLDITDSDEGIIKIRTDGISSSIEDINDRIETLQQRIDNESERLLAQFRAMESTLAELQSQSTFLSNSLNQISQLNTRTSG